MSLNQQIKQPQLLDTLQELNELVKGLLSPELTGVIDDLKQKTEVHKKAEEEADASVQANAASIMALEEVTAENEKYAALAKRQREALAAEKQENDKQLAKIAAEQEKLDNGKKDLERKHAASVTDLEQKSQAIALREKKVAERQLAVDALRTEYEDKLNKLKTIAG